MIFICIAEMLVYAGLKIFFVPSPNRDWALELEFSHKSCKSVCLLNDED